MSVGVFEMIVTLDIRQLLTLEIFSADLLFGFLPGVGLFRPTCLARSHCHPASSLLQLQLAWATSLSHIFGMDIRSQRSLHYNPSYFFRPLFAREDTGMRIHNFPASQHGVTSRPAASVLGGSPEVLGPGSWGARAWREQLCTET